MQNSSLTIAVINRGGNDPQLVPTLQNALDVADGAQVMLVLDGKCDTPVLPDGVVVRVTDDMPRGTSYARHFAVMVADGDIVITADSHVVMGADFITAVRDHLGRFRNHAVCARCEMLPDGGTYNGAKINTYVLPNPADGSTNKCVGEYQAIAAQWRNDDRAGAVGAIMGGCYAIRKDWYQEIGAPWQHGKGWGCDEETISIATQAHGGKCWLLPQVVAHWSQCTGGPKYRPMYSDTINVWANRLRIAMTSPTDDEEREKLVAFLLSSSYFKRQEDIDRVWQVLKDVPCDEIREANNRYGVTLQQIKEGVPMTRQELIKAIEDNGAQFKGFRRAKIEVLQAAYDVIGAAEPEPEPEPPKRKAMANYGAFEDRRTCHKCGSAVSVINNGGTRTVGRVTIRYRTCECGQRRPTREVLPA